MRLALWIASLGLAVTLGMPVSFAADKSVTPDGKPAPSQPAAKPGSQAAIEKEEAAKTPYNEVREVFSGNQTVAGEDIRFPQNNPSIHSLVVTMAPGEETEWHQHHAPLYAYILEGEMDLSRFDAAPLIAFTAPKETDYGTETDGRISPRCGAYRIDQWADA
jgi:hypothetical protein